MFKPAVDVESLQPKKDIQAKVREILCGQVFPRHTISALLTKMKLKNSGWSRREF